MNKQLFWVGGAIGIATNALSLLKLTTHFLEIGFVGVPRFILDSYTGFVADLRYWLVELPFGITVPELAAHLFIVWILFAGSNYRFLTYKAQGSGEENGARLYRGFGDFGRGEKAGKSPKVVLLLNVLFSSTGPLFAIFILAMWLGNRRPGPGGQGRWGDLLMIGNRVYTVRLSRIYLLILLLAPTLAALLLAWGAAGSLN